MWFGQFFYVAYQEQRPCWTKSISAFSTKGKIVSLIRSFGDVYPTCMTSAIVYSMVFVIDPSLQQLFLPSFCRRSWHSHRVASQTRSMELQPRLVVRYSFLTPHSLVPRRFRHSACIPLLHRPMSSVPGWLCPIRAVWNDYLHVGSVSGLILSGLSVAINTFGLHCGERLAYISWSSYLTESSLRVQHSRSEDHWWRTMDCI